MAASLSPTMGTPWDARTYDSTSEPQQEWAADVLARLQGIAPQATVLDVGCGTGLVTEQLLGLVPGGRVLAIDASQDMVELARLRLGERAQVWCVDALELELDEPVDAIFSTAALHWVPDHDRLWTRLARALKPGGVLEIQCGGEGNIAHVREVIESVARELAPELVGWSPWVFASPQETERRLREAGFTQIKCWLEQRPTYPQDVNAFVRTSILAAHLERLGDEDRGERFASAVVAGVRLPLDYVRLNASALRHPARSSDHQRSGGRLHLCARPPRSRVCGVNHAVATARAGDAPTSEPMWGYVRRCATVARLRCGLALCRCHHGWCPVSARRS